MSRISSSWTGFIVLNTEQGYVECPAKFDIEGEEYPAEPYSWGGSRGMELEIGAELISAQLGGLTLDRDMVEAITGKDDLASQENSIANKYAEAFRMGDAA